MILQRKCPYLQRHPFISQRGLLLFSLSDSLLRYTLYLTSGSFNFCKVQWQNQTRQRARLLRFTNCRQSVRKHKVSTTAWVSLKFFFSISTNNGVPHIVRRLPKKTSLMYKKPSRTNPLSRWTRLRSRSPFQTVIGDNEKFGYDCSLIILILCFLCLFLFIEKITTSVVPDESFYFGSTLSSYHS